MKIRRKAGIRALTEGRIRELAVAIVERLEIKEFIEMDIDSIYDTFSEDAFIKTADMEISIRYPRVKAGKLEYNWIECKYKDKKDTTTSYYIIIDGSLKIQQYGSGVGEIKITSQKGLLEMAKKSPQILALLYDMRKVIDPVELVPKIQELLGVNLKDLDEFNIERQIFAMKKGKIVGIGEQTEEFSDWYSLEGKEFEYSDSSCHIKCKGNDAIMMTVKGSYKKLKDVSVKDLNNLAKKKKKELIEKMEKIKL